MLAKKRTTGWSKRKPNRSGFYFWRPNPETPDVVIKIYRAPNGTFWLRDSNGFSIGLAAINSKGLWYRIPNPPEPKG